VLPVDALNSTVVATLIWDEAPVPEDERLALRYRFPAEVQQAIYEAKIQAEAS
jgi:hypothetical protein